MRRYLLRLLTLACLALTFAAARGAAPPVTVRVWLPGFGPYRDAIIRDFQAEYPDLRLNLVCQAPETFQRRLLEAVVTHTAPDLSLVEFSGLGALVGAGASEPLDRYLADMRDAAALNPLLPRMLVHDGKVHGLPVTGHPLALYIRQDWLARLGLKAPATWDEFALVAEAFTKKDPDGNGKHDTYGLAERWPSADPSTATRLLPWLYQGGGAVATNAAGKWEPGFGLAAGIKALKLRRRLWEAGCIAPGAPMHDAAHTLALFTSGRAGMLIEDDRRLAAVRQALGANAAVAPLPRDIKASTVGDGLCFVLSSRSNHKAAAFTFVQWWVSRAAQQKLILGWDGKPGGTGPAAGALVLGPRQDLDPAALLGEPLLAGFVKSFPLMAPEPYCPNYAQLRFVVAAAVSAAMGPEKTVEEALAAGMKEAGVLLGK